MRRGRRRRSLKGGRKRNTSKRQRGGMGHGALASQLYRAAPALALAAMLSRKRSGRSFGKSKRKRSRRRRR